MKNNVKYLSNSSPVSMDDDWFDIANKEHFWIKWRFLRLIKILKNIKFNVSNKSLLEIGCGHGIVIAQTFDRYKVKMDGCDLNEFALDKIEQPCGDIYCYDILTRSNELRGKYDAVILFDVLEHIDDHKTFLEACHFHLKPGGRVFINVPAYRMLYSAYDKQVGHIRRYSIKTLREVVEDSGLISEKYEYWGFPLFFLLLVRSVFLKFRGNDIVSSGFKPPFALFNSFMIVLAKIEAVFPYIPFGSSLMSVSIKPQD